MAVVEEGEELVLEGDNRDVQQQRVVDEVDEKHGADHGPREEDGHQPEKQDQETLILCQWGGVGVSYTKSASRSSWPDPSDECWVSWIRPIRDVLPKSPVFS